MLGVQLFTYVVHQHHLNADTNFDTLANAALLLFQCLTGDGWGVLMTETSVDPSSGKCSEAAGDCGSGLAMPYFVSFVIAGPFVFLNLVVAVMIESFTELGKEPDHSEDIVSAWRELTFAPRVAAYMRALKTTSHPDSELPGIEAVAHARLRDTYGWDCYKALADIGLREEDWIDAEPVKDHADLNGDIWMIRAASLRELLLQLPPPIGLKGMVASYSDATKLCFRLHLATVNGRVRFRDVVKALLQARLTASALESPSANGTMVRADSSLSSSSARQQGGRHDSAAQQLALDSLGEQIRRRRRGLGALAGPTRLGNSRRVALPRSKDKHLELSVPEHAWRTVTSGVYFPVGPKKVRWDAMVMAMVVYSVALVPYRVSFEAPAVGNWWFFEVFVTLVFMADLVAEFNTAFRDSSDGRWVISRVTIARRYLRGGFWVDAPAAIPVELLLLAFPQDPVDGSDTSTLKLLRALRLVRLVRMLKLLRLNEYIAMLETSLKVNLRVLKIFKMVGMLLFLMHLLGCAWFAIAANGGYSTSWLSEYDDGSGLEEPPTVQYLYSVYWALVTITTVGATLWERRHSRHAPSPSSSCAH